MFLLVMTQIESNNANVDDAIMLDKDGFVSETNATNIVSNPLMIYPQDFISIDY